MRKVLVITYYWPPGGGAGVQRWLKFVKYLRNFGWEPIVYTPENPEWPDVDNSLEQDIPSGLTVLKTKIWEPYTAYKRFVGRKKDNGIKAGFLSEKKNPSLTEKISVWIRGNFFIPDARKFWIKPSVKYLSEWLKNNPVDAIVSTGPPHSMHLIAMAIHEKLRLPWLADFRDPWTNIDFYSNLMLSKKSDKKHHRLEKEVLSKADKIVVVSEGMSRDFQSVAGRQYDVITNGFDNEIQLPNDVVPDIKFSLAHIGSMVPSRNPENLWKALDELLLEEKDLAENLEIKLIGAVDFSVREMLAKYRLENYTSMIPYLPHTKVIKIQQAAQVLLLIINNTPNAKMVTTGKIFEYISSGRPVLCVGPVAGDAAGIISETNSGISVDQQDLKSIKTAIKNYYLLYKQAKLKSESKDISKYTRRNLTKKLAEILDDMIS
jgi:hypothetical protein